MHAGAVVESRRRSPGREAGDEGGAGVQPPFGPALDALQPLHQRVAVGAAGGADASLQLEQRPPDGAAAAGDAIACLALLPAHKRSQVGTIEALFLLIRLLPGGGHWLSAGRM